MDIEERLAKFYTKELLKEHIKDLYELEDRYMSWDESSDSPELDYTVCRTDPNC